MKRLVGLFVLAFFFALGFPLSHAAHADEKMEFDGREVVVHLPPKLPAQGQRAMVVALHGGMGNAEQLESTLGLNEVADRYGFIAVYLNGTKVAGMMRDIRKGWNAGGGCCGLPFKNNVDDVGYITAVVHKLADQYGVSQKRIFGMGHSNGAIMTQRLMCDVGLYAAAVPISGPLNYDVQTCPAAKGLRILAIHGADDENVPIAGGKGTKGISGVTFKPQTYGEGVFKSSGADYTLYIVPGADHNLKHISDALKASQGVTVAEKAAQFFGLMPE